MNNSGLAVTTLSDAGHARAVRLSASGAVEHFISDPASRGELMVDINEAGVSVGTMLMPDGRSLPAIASERNIEALPLAGFEGGQAFRINDVGITAGYVYGGTTGAARPAIWSSTGLVTLPVPQYGGNATDINNSGIVAGWVNITHDSLRPAVWSAGQMTTLPSLGGNWAQAVRINDANQVLCMTEDSTGQMRAYRWTSGVMEIIGSEMPGFIDMRDMNRAGACVGSVAGDDSTAILFENGVTYRLEDLTEGLGSWRLSQGVAINDAGLILVTAWNNGVEQPVLLLPIPTPAVAELLILSPWFGRRRRART